MIRRDTAVLKMRKFREKIPDYRPGKPFVYVSVTLLDPAKRREQHKDGYEASRIAREYGKHLNPVPAAEAENREGALAARTTEAMDTECGSTDGLRFNSSAIEPAQCLSQARQVCERPRIRMS